MKEKITRKFLKQNYTIINTGGGNVQNLLRWESPDYYCARTEGWAFDAYIFGNYAILDGDACIGKLKPYETMKRYDEEAKVIADRYPFDADYNDTKDALRELIYRFCEEVTA